ncbi:MAG: transporter substrate-binding domain-containing protein [Xanthomonadaceae bacterium]|nr:transporter substrate-binding domain-containing protein [Xanthomonadaceae bacterium]
MKRNVILLTISLLMLALPAGLIAGETLKRVESKGVLKVATSPNWPPQSFINDNNEMDGFDVDVAKEVAKRLGVKVKFVTPDWNIITSGRWNGRWDLSVGSMTPTKKRAEVLDFPAIYHYSTNSFVVHKDSKAMKMADLEGKKIGVAAGSTGDLYMKRKLVIDAVNAPEVKYAFKTDDIKAYTAIAPAWDDLRLGDGVRLDAVIDNRNALEKAVKSGYPFRVLDGAAFAEPLALATDKGDAEFNQKLAEIVKAMRSEGVLKNISLKWFGLDTTKVE